MVNYGLSFITAVITGSKSRYNSYKGGGYGQGQNAQMKALKDTPSLGLEPNVYTLIAPFCESAFGTTGTNFSVKTAAKYKAAHDLSISGKSAVVDSGVTLETRKLPYMSGDVRNILHLEMRKYILTQQVYISI